MAAMKQGQKVLAFLDEGDGLIGFVLHGPGLDGKHVIQVGEKVYPLAYREPADYDKPNEGPKGLTFRKLAG